MEGLKLEELTQAVHNYIRETYSYDSADVFEDTITYYLEDGKVVNVYIDLESEEK